MTDKLKVIVMGLQERLAAMTNDQLRRAYLGCVEWGDPLLEPLTLACQERDIDL